MSSDSCRMRRQLESVSPYPPPPPTGVSVSPLSVTVTAGGVQQFTATVSPSGANQAVTWSLSVPQFAPVQPVQGR
jgi:uncharacterized protein YjdB